MNKDLSRPYFWKKRQNRTQGPILKPNTNKNYFLEELKASPKVLRLITDLIGNPGDFLNAN